jgi:hypothetical protein
MAWVAARPCRAIDLEHRSRIPNRSANKANRRE